MKTLRIIAIMNPFKWIVIGIVLYVIIKHTGAVLPAICVLLIIRLAFRLVLRVIGTVFRIGFWLLVFWLLSMLTF